MITKGTDYCELTRGSTVHASYQRCHSHTWHRDQGASSLGKRPCVLASRGGLTVPCQSRGSGAESRASAERDCDAACCYCLGHLPSLMHLKQSTSTGFGESARMRQAAAQPASWHRLCVVLAEAGCSVGAGRSCEVTVVTLTMTCPFP